MATGRLLSIHEVLEEVNARLRLFGLIKDASEEVSTRTFRYYRSRDLLPDPEGVGPKARYPESVLDTIVFIRRLQKERPELSLETIAEVLPEISETSVRAVARGEEPLVVPDLHAVREATMLSAPMGHDPDPFTRAEMAQDHVIAGDARMAPSSVRKHYARQIRDSVKLGKTRDSETFQRIPLTEDVELNVRRKLSRKELEQLGIIGELIKSILGSGGK